MSVKESREASGDFANRVQDQFRRESTYCSDEIRSAIVPEV